MKQVRAISLLLRRELIHANLRMLIAALCLAIACITTLNLFIERTLIVARAQVSQLFGADRAIRSNQPIPKEWIRQAQDLGLRTSLSVKFPSVVAQQDKLQLISVKVVDQHYPLRGQIRIADTLTQQAYDTNNVPALGEIWVGKRLLYSLNVTVGDRITIGQHSFKIAKILDYEPDQENLLTAVAARVMMNINDLPATQVIQPGSRINYGLLLAGDTHQLQLMYQRIKPQLSAGQTWETAINQRSALGRLITNLENYLHLMVLIIFMMSSVIIMLSCNRYARQQTRYIAMLRSIGLTGRHIMLIYASLILCIGLLAAFLGGLIGYGIYGVLFYAFQQQWAWWLSWQQIHLFFVGIGAGVLIYLALLAPPLWRLNKINAVHVLQHNFNFTFTTWLSYLNASIVFLLFMIFYTQNPKLNLLLLASIIIFAGLLFSISYLLLRFVTQHKQHLVLTAQHIVQRLVRHWQASITHIVAFGLVIMFMLLVSNVAWDLVQTWRAKLPANTPNYFAINIPPTKINRFEQFIQTHQIQASDSYPIVRGRLVTLNGQAILDAIPQSARQHNALYRELNFTAHQQFPAHNKLTAGQWWSEQTALPASNNKTHTQVSVEAGLANQLGIHLGDQLGFRIGAFNITARVTSLREVDWANFKPNFYFIFPPTVLDNLPATYMASLFIASQQLSLLPQIVKDIPSITLIDITQLQQQALQNLAQVKIILQFVSVFLVIAAILLLQATITNSLQERMTEHALLRSFGVSHRQLRRLIIGEFLASSLVAGLLAGIGANVVGFIVSHTLFGITYHFNFGLLLGGITISCIIIVGSSMLTIRQVLLTPPMALFKQ
ncbi:MAG: ABC transporter permease [Gammaproteobacteria bacterium]